MNQFIDLPKFIHQTQEPAQQPEQTDTKDIKIKKRKKSSLFETKILSRALIDALKKLDPRIQSHNPVMFVVEVGSVITSVEFFRALFDSSLSNQRGFIFAVAAWLWFTLLFANFAEAMAEGRGKAQAESLRKTRIDAMAKLLSAKTTEYQCNLPYTLIAATQLRKDNLVLIETGDIIPSDGEIVTGVASVDESAITGESAPVIR